MPRASTSPVTFANINFPAVPSWRSGHIVGSMELAADIVAQHVAQDPTTRPAAFFWWSAPQAIRLEVFHRYGLTEQREKLLEARVLDRAAAKLARERVAKSRASNEPVAAHDLREQRPEIKV